MRRAVLPIAGSLIVLTVLGPASGARTAKPVPAREVQLTLLGRFEFPVYATSPPGDKHRLFVVEKPGRIKVVVDGKTLSVPFLDIAARVAPGNEPGLLSLAFSPRYATDGLLYIYYVGTDKHTHLVEYRRSATNPDRADIKTRREVLSFVHLSGEHFGGLLLFGPDRRLYLSTGDGGLNEWQDKMRAQRTNDPNGKILRVNPATGATRVVARGLRNPWRYAIDEKTGDLYVGDAGEYVRESIEFAPAARRSSVNFGWPCFEGSIASAQYPAGNCPGAQPPLYEYAREGGNCSVIGGVVVRDPRLPLLAGRFLYADYCLGEVIVLNVQKGRLASRRSLRIYEPGITSFGVDGRNRIFVTKASGEVYRIDPRRTGRDQAAAARTGKELFLASGCGTCHTLAAAGTGGTYGPRLDETKPSRARVVERVTFGKGAMPSFGGRLTARQIEAIADFVTKR